MLSAADIERRLLAALAEPPETAETRKRAFLDVLRVLGQSGERFAISGDLGLWLRAMRPGAMRLEVAIGSLERIPRAALQAEGFTVGKTTCSRQGTKIRFRAVRPAALDRAETFGRLSVLGASDLLAGKLDDANAEWMPPGARRMAVVEAERLLAQNPEAADDVSKAKKTLEEAREKLTKWKEEPMRQKTKLEKVIGIAKELMTLFGIFVLLVGCDGGGGTVEADGGGQGTGGLIVCQSGSACPVGNCLTMQSTLPSGYTGYCCDGCPELHSWPSGATDVRNYETCLPFNYVDTRTNPSSYCGIGPDGVDWIPLVPPKTAPTCPCADATGTCRSAGYKITIPVTLTSRSKAPTSGLPIDVTTTGKQTITCDGTTWR